MATELGQAYVQIMPSAKGISGSIQKTINPEATAAGKSAGSRIASSIASSMGKAGKTLTKAITLPALGAATAVGGIVAAFGWKRLVGLDSARSQLLGLGYDAKSVDRISELVNKSIQGTVTTMAEGVAIAAGGLAAGVKEGAELEKYIQLVGDAAVGANRPVNDMAQIFNRVQGSGKLMTQELNMIEDGMPGFAMAMSKSLGVSQEEFRKMVTAGKVSSEDFLKVMDSFAGEMSGAYANSWQGMVSNTKAWIGIIGENILSGVFEKSKESIAEFMEFLKSDDVQAWAKEMGATVGEAFSNLIENVKDLINWWTNLDGGTQKLIGVFAGIAVAIGPILMGLSKLITTIITLKPLFAIIGTAIGGITLPIGIAIAAIIAAAALIFMHWEPIKEFFMTMWEAIKEIAINSWTAIMEFLQPAIQAIVDFAMEIWGTFVDFWQEHGEMILQAAQNVWNVISTVIETVMGVIWTIMQTIWPVIQLLIVSTWEAIKGVIQGAINVITGIIQLFSALFTGNWTEMWEAVKQIISGAVQFLWNYIQVAFVGRILKAGATLAKTFGKTISSMWETIRIVFMTATDFVKGVVARGFGAINTTVSSVMNFIRGIISSVWNGIKGTITTVVNGIRSTISNIFNSLRGIVSSAFSGVTGAVRNGMSSAFNAVTGFLGKFKTAGRNIVTSIADGIKGAIGKVTGAISNVTQKIRDFLPFSPPKTGPLMDIMDVKWGETISGGIEKGEGTVAKAMEDILNFDLANKATFNNPNGLSGGGNNDVTQLLNELIDAVQKGQNISLFPDGGTFAKKTGDYTSKEGGNRIRRFERGLA